MFDTTSLRIERKDGSLVISAPPLEKSPTMKDKGYSIDEVLYIAYAAVEERQLYSAMMCYEGDYLDQPVPIENIGEDQISVQFPVILLIFRFSN